ncbi:formin-binding protein 1-like isoform X2 [Tigriopus californicus]|uniref:formin-binding protein 1-like isoform X2 n=1 Tax=Tigriopus californicus TaxID=6832 RepID=UPI0027DA469B|nr:formin-binding protein 1-like isoform X2 [Tigriopus californicus]
MSWGTELWDQYDNIATHTHKGIEFLEKYGNFVDQRCKIEQEYATKLRRLVKQFVPRKKEEEDYQFTYTKAYKNLLNELGDQAGQHELIAETLSSQVVQELASLVKQLKDDRRKHLTEGARIQAQLQSSLTFLGKTKEKYEKAFGASERALDAYQKADADLNLSRAEVEKQRMNSTIKSQQCDDAKNEYANQLQKANESQTKYYQHLLPTVFQNLQDLDEKRIKCIQNFILKSVQSEKDVLPIVNQCLEGMEKCAEEIDEAEDTRMVIERYKSGFIPPSDIPFEDLSNAETSSVNGSMNSIGHNSSIPAIPGSVEKKTILGTITGGRVKKRSGLLGLFANNKEDFSDLPPNQRKKKLQQKIDELNGKVCQETAARDGLMKMKQVYEGNPALGDPMSIQGQLSENGHKLDKLRAELKKFQGYLDEMEGRISSSPGNTLTPNSRKNSNGTIISSNHVVNNSSPNRRSSVSDGAESLSRSASDSSVSNPSLNHNKAMNTPLHSQGNSNSPESGIVMSGNHHHGESGSDSMDGYGGDMLVRVVEGQDGLGDHNEDEFFDAEPLPVLGRCKALYPFEVTSEGSIRMTENEDLWVIEADQGDGWTRVRRINISALDPMPEGFVPSTYIEVTEMFSVPHPV